MCVAIPMKLIEIHGDRGIVEAGGMQSEIGLHLLEDLRVGDYVLVHAGFAIQKVDEKEAQTTLALLKEMENLF